jgi:2-oxoglutarate ferredoxin oxidoreductase subunit gamma
MITRIVFSGTGGQGIITAAVVFAEAAALYGGLEVTQTQSYGPEARGGAARADVILATDPIGFPKVLEPNILVALSQEAYDKYAWAVRPGGIIILDSGCVTARSSATARLSALPFTQAVEEQVGSKVPANMAVVGALAGIVPSLDLDSFAQVVARKFDTRFRQANLSALHIGHQLIETKKTEQNFALF